LTIIAGIIASFWFGSFWLAILFPLIGVSVAYVGCFIYGLSAELIAAEHDRRQYTAALRDHEEQVRKNQLDYENLCHSTLIAHQRACESGQRAFIENKNESLVNNQLAYIFNKKIGSSQLQIEAQLIVLTSSLKSLYDMDVIYPKYRNLIAISSIFEYIESYRCNDLVEAYNKFDLEKKLDSIIGRLDVVIAKLEELKEIHYKLYAEMKLINENLGVIKSSLDVVINELLTQSRANARQLSGLSDNISLMNVDMEKCFREVDEYLMKLDRTSDKALAYLAKKKKKKKKK